MDHEFSYTLEKRFMKNFALAHTEELNFEQDTGALYILQRDLLVHSKHITNSCFSCAPTHLPQISLYSTSPPTISALASILREFIELFCHLQQVSIFSIVIVEPLLAWVCGLPNENGDIQNLKEQWEKLICTSPPAVTR